MSSKSPKRSAKLALCMTKSQLEKGVNLVDSFVQIASNLDQILVVSLNVGGTEEIRVQTFPKLEDFFSIVSEMIEDGVAGDGDYGILQNANYYMFWIKDPADYQTFTYYVYNADEEKMNQFALEYLQNSENDKEIIQSRRSKYTTELSDEDSDSEK